MPKDKPIFRSYSAPGSPDVANYSHVIEPLKPGRPVQLSGIVGIDVGGTGKLAKGGTGPETECILKEVERQLKKARLSLRHVMSVRVMIADPVSCDSCRGLSDDFNDMNEVYNRIFKDNNPPPSRDTVGGCALLHHARVEMVITAWRPDEEEFPGIG